MKLVLLDTNLLLVLIVGRADQNYIAIHKRTADYHPSDYLFLERLLSTYDNAVSTPHVLAEASNLLRQINNPARDLIQGQLREFVRSCDERFIASTLGCAHPQHLQLGLTDATLLIACAQAIESGDYIELFTADEPTYNHARSRGLVAELYA